MDPLRLNKLTLTEGLCLLRLDSLVLEVATVTEPSETRGMGSFMWLNGQNRGYSRELQCVSFS